MSGQVSLFALSLRQPWLHAVLHLGKDVENRTWRSGFRGRVVLHASDTTAWTVVREIDREPRPAPLHRFVRVHPVAGAADLLEAVAPYGRHLAAVAIEGFGAQTGELVRGLLGLGASRVCAPGRLQAPPLAWPQDGQGILLPLARLSGVET